MRSAWCWPRSAHARWSPRFRTGNAGSIAYCDDCGRVWRVEDLWLTTNAETAADFEALAHREWYSPEERQHREVVAKYEPASPLLKRVLSYEEVTEIVHRVGIAIEYDDFAWWGS